MNHKAFTVHNNIISFENFTKYDDLMGLMTSSNIFVGDDI